MEKEQVRSRSNGWEMEIDEARREGKDGVRRKKGK